MRIKNFLNPIILALFLFCTSLCVYAADENLGLIVDGSELTEKEYSESTAFPKARGIYFSNGTGSIGISGTRKINVSGTTTAYKTCDSVKVTLYVQRYINGGWSTIATYGPKTAYNNYFVSASNTYSVTGGYYYRVKGIHSVTKGSTTESASSYTEGIWIS